MRWSVPRNCNSEKIKMRISNLNLRIEPRTKVAISTDELRASLEKVCKEIPCIILAPIDNRAYVLSMISKELDTGEIYSIITNAGYSIKTRLQGGCDPNEKIIIRK